MEEDRERVRGVTWVWVWVGSGYLCFGLNGFDRESRFGHSSVELDSSGCNAEGGGASHTDM